MKSRHERRTGNRLHFRHKNPVNADCYRLESANLSDTADAIAIITSD